MSYGFMGKILEVDLTSGTTQERPSQEADFRKYLGASGVAGKILMEEFDSSVDPLDEKNPLIFMAGLLTGTGVPAAAKSSVVSKSPLTGIWCESTVGGHVGTQLKKCGYDGIILTGKSDRSVYLYITDEQVELKPADHIIGKDTFATSEAIQSETGDKAQVAAIGPAGEKMSKMASIMAGGNEARAVGRGGMGAIMGSKNLKAVALKGNQKIQTYDSDDLKTQIKEFMPTLKEGTKGLHDYGTAGGVMTVEANGDLPIKNWTLGEWEEGAKKTCGQYMEEYGITVSHHTCAGCPIRCGKDARVDVGPFKGTVGHGPEFETLSAFGSNLLNEDIYHLVAVNDMCNRFGLDTIETGNTTAMAMECLETGQISQDQLDGIELTWGNGPAIMDFVEKIGKQEGKVAEYFGQGVLAAANKLTGLAEEFAVHVKGMSVAYHDPRAFTSMAANYATANRGGCHLEALTYFAEGGAWPPEPYGFDKPLEKHSDENKAELAVNMQDYMDAYNALGLCKFLIRGKTTPEHIVNWINAVAGWDMTQEELKQAGERLHNMKRIYNVNLGISRKDDQLPPRLEYHDRETGAAGGILPNMSKILTEYYQHRGWNKEGIPTEKKLSELGLDNFEVRA